MAIPKLSFPVSANIDSFKKSMNETSSIARNATKQILNQFADMNKGMAAAGAASGASWALGWVGRIALVVGAYKLMGSAISATRDQIKEMVELADKSQTLGVSPTFMQSWTAESRKLKVGTEDMEAALAHAFQATKDRAPIDLAKWETGEEQITSVEKALRVYNETYAKTAGQQLEGLVLFREATSQEEKIQAVLKAMIQLEQIGQRAAALDVGEKMFGSAFVDRIRQGRTSAESILGTMQDMASADAAIYSSAMVARAKEVDDQLRLSEERLSRALKPSFDDLASVMLTIKDIWADTVGLIGQAVELANKLGVLGNEASRLKKQRDELDDSIKNGNEVSVFGLKTGIRLPADVISSEQNKQKRDEIQARIDDLERQPNNYPRQEQSRGAGPAPTLKPTGAETDKFATSADAIEKRTAALQAEAGAIDLGTAARERAKITAQLETVAKQANIAAGLGENVVTQEQRKTIDEVANAYANAAQEMEKARVGSSINFGQKTSLLDPQDVQIASQLRNIYPDVATALGSVEAQAMRTNAVMSGLSATFSSTMTTGLADMLDGTKSVSQSFADMSKAIIRALEEALIKMLIVAPMMRALQGLMGGGGGLLGSLLGFSGGGYVGDYGQSFNAAGLAAGTGGMSFPVFARGGYTGSGGKYEPAGIVHKGEYVIDAENTRRIGIANLDRLRGYAEGGVVGATSGEVRQRLRPAEKSDSAPPVQITNHYTFNGVEPGMEARMRAYIDQGDQRSVTQAVQATQKTAANTPAFRGSFR